MKTRLLFAGILVLLSSTLAAQGSGKAYDFSSTFLSVPHSSSLSPTTTITLEAWIKADSYSPNNWENVIISKDGWGSGNQGYTLRTGANGVLNFNFSSNGTWREIATPAVMTPGNWYHVAGTYDGSTLRVYINGIEQNTLAFSGPITNGTMEMTIGKMSFLAGGTRFFDGMIDEVRVWSTAIPVATLRQYMCKKVTSSHPNYAALGGYWNMDVAGPVLDQSPNGNNGTVNGATLVNSGAAIGDESVFSYASNANLTLPFGAVDTAVVTSTNSLPLAHLYRIDGAPVVANLGATLDSIDQTHYYGVYVSPVTVSNYQFVQRYGANPLAVGNENYLNLAVRNTGSSTPWTTSPATVDPIANTINYAGSGRKEMILAIACPSVVLTPGTAQNVCVGNTVNLSISSAATNIQWFNGASLIPGATLPTYAASTTGVYSVTANTGVCAKTSSNVSVTIQPLPIVDFGNLPSNTFCVTTGLQTITNFVPATGGTFSGPGIFNSTFTPNMAPVGTHTLYYNFTNSFGCSNVDSFVVTLGAAPAAPLITQTGLQLCTPACGTFVWSLNGTVIPGATANCYTASANGTYSVICVTPEGCTSTVATSVVAGLSLNEPDWALGLEISPNPTQNYVLIAFPNQNKDIMTYTVTDLKGRKVDENMFNGQSQVIDLSKLENGVYLLTLSQKTTQIVRRIVKE